MKRLILGILWGYLLVIGTYGMIQVWTVEGLPLWMDAILRIPLAMWTMWTFIMFYDVWMAARSPVSKFNEAAQVEMKPGSLIYINGTLYRFTEISSSNYFEDSSSTIILKSVSKGPHIHTVSVQSDDGM